MRNNVLSQIADILRPLLGIESDENDSDRVVVSKYNKLAIKPDNDLLPSLYRHSINSVYPNYFQKDITISLPIYANSGSTQYSFVNGSASTALTLMSYVFNSPFWNGTVYNSSLPNFEYFRINRVTFEYFPDNLSIASTSTLLPYMLFSYLPTYTSTSVPSLTWSRVSEHEDVMKTGPSEHTTYTYVLGKSPVFGNTVNPVTPTQWLDTAYVNQYSSNIPGCVFMATPSNNVASGGTSYAVGTLMITVGCELAKCLN